MFGGAIVADELDLTTGALEVTDLNIHDDSRGAQGAIELNQIRPVGEKTDGNSYGALDYKDSGHAKEGEINSTIASNSGSITIGGNKVSKEDLESQAINTNADAIHIITKDKDWNHDLTAELIDLGATKKQIEDIQNAYKSLTATVPDYVTAQGPNAEDIYRKAIANGLDGKDLEVYANSRGFSDAVDLRNTITKKAAEHGSFDGIPKEDLETILQVEILSFQQNLTIIDCASGAGNYKVCRDLAERLSQEVGHVADLDGSRLSQIITDYKALLEGTANTSEGIGEREYYNTVISLAQACLEAQNPTEGRKTLQEEGELVTVDVILQNPRGEMQLETIDYYVLGDVTAPAEIIDLNINLANISPEYKAKFAALDKSSPSYEQDRRALLNELQSDVLGYSSQVKDIKDKYFWVSDPETGQGINYVSGSEQIRVWEEGVYALAGDHIFSETGGGSDKDIERYLTNLETGSFSGTTLSSNYNLALTGPNPHEFLESNVVVGGSLGVGGLLVKGGVVAKGVTQGKQLISTPAGQAALAGLELANLATCENAVSCYSPGIGKGNLLPNKNKVILTQQNKTLLRRNGLSKSKSEKFHQSAFSEKNKNGLNRLGHAFEKHANRFPDRWGTAKGNVANKNKLGEQNYNDILTGAGKFKKVKNSSGQWTLEKRLPDGRGMRLDLDGNFKGFLDPLE